QLVAIGGNGFGLLEPFLGVVHLPPVATGAPRYPPGQHSLKGCGFAVVRWTTPARSFAQPAGVLKPRETWLLVRGCSWRPATTTPAFQPGARPSSGRCTA